MAATIFGSPGNRMMNKSGLLVSLVLGLAASACNSSPSEPKYRVDTKDASEPTGEDARLRKLQAIKVFNPDMPEGQQYSEWEAADISWLVGELCSVRHRCIAPDPPVDGFGQMRLGCGDSFLRTACDLVHDTCVSETLNEIAEAAVVPVALQHSTVPWHYTIPPQSEPARLAILNEVRFRSQLLTFKAMSLLNGLFYNTVNPYAYQGLATPGATCNFAYAGQLTSSPTPTELYYQPDAAPTATLDGRRVSQIVTSALLTGERLARSSAFAAADKTVAIAEWDRGTAGSFSEAQERAFSRDQFSRAAAAHILVGGSPGLRVNAAVDPNTEEVPSVPAFCLAQPLSSSGQRAMRALRESGIAPEVITGPFDTETLVQGSLQTGSVAQRLPFIRLGAAPTPYDEYAVSLADFKEARNYMAQELLAFNRTRIATVGALGPYPRYAGTAGKPPRRPDAFYTAIARQRSSPLADRNVLTRPYLSAPSDFGIPGALPGPNSLSGFYADVTLWLNETLEFYAHAEVSSNYRLVPEVDADTLPVRLLFQRLSDEAKAIVISDYANCPAVDCWQSNLYLATKQYSSVAIVVGEDGITCALDGNAEGGSCDGIAQVTDVFAPSPGWIRSTNYSLILSNASGLTDRFDERSYIYGTLANGKKELVASLPALHLEPGSDSAARVFIRHAVMPDIEAKVAEYLRPSPDWCAHADVECNGQRFDARLPLENELDDNNDGVENSWKYYLSRAEAAAAQADQLGQDYLNASLTAQRDEIEGQRAAVAQRTQVDAEMETLQQICGLSASSEDLLRLFGQEGNLEQLASGEECSITADCADGTRQCVGGRCLLVPATLVGSQDGATVLSRLATCLGVDSVIPEVVVGDHAVCVHSSGELCRSDDPLCPVPVPNAQDADAYCTNLPNYISGTWKAISTRLGYVEVPDDFPYSNFTRLPTRTQFGDYHNCRLKSPPSATTSWYKITPWTGWLENDQCWGRDPQICPPQTNCLMPTFGRTAEMDRYTFPFFDPPGNDQANGNSIEVTSCPSRIEYDDLKDLNPRMQVYLLKTAIECNAGKLRTTLGTRVLSDLPRDVVNVLKQQGPLGKVTGLGGEYGQAIADLRSNIIARREATNAMQEEAAGIGSDLQRYLSDLETFGLQGQELTLESQQLDLQKVINSLRRDELQSRAFFSALSGSLNFFVGAASGNYAAATGGVIQAMSDVTDADIQTRIIEAEDQILDLKKKGIDVRAAEIELQKARRFVDTLEAINRRVFAIQAHANQIHASLEEWDGKLSAIESLRNRASRALSRAVSASSNQLAQQEQRLVRASSSLANVQKLRYDEAFNSAVGLSFLAKRAIETRIGRHFSEMTETMPLLSAAPATWENEICVATGLDYNQIANAEPSNLPQGALSGFLGTYVNKLKNVVDAYQLQYAFREGSDLLTISLKDDVFRSRAACTAPSRNLLKETGVPNTMGPGGAGPLIATPTPPLLDKLQSSNWTQPGCTSDNCVWIGETSDAVADFGVLSQTPPLLVYAKGATMSQTVALTTGDYVLSWYQADGKTGSTVRLFDPDQGTIVPPATSDGYASHTHSGRQWTRQVRGYHIPQTTTVRVDIAPGVGSANEYDWVEIGAPMLEKLAPGSTFVPSEFQMADAAGNSTEPCQDSDGRAFRENYWSHDCQSSCAQGSTGLCTDSQRILRCYWEASFPITVKDIEQGRLLRNNGFALGNYNYRIEELALNVVGSGLRNCSETSNLSCYATAYVPFSLSHLGPFTVRNHTGADAFISIFDGKIEWAKALAAERYLTNPLSNTDDSLLRQYTRQEFRGRPLDGNYVVRIWDDSEFDFDKVQDVQLLLRYRYWTATK